MTFTLSEVVPWGRRLSEYQRMFALDESHLSQRIFGCGDGPASFNAELTAQGGNVTSGDPLYRFNAEQIGQRIDAVFDDMINQTRVNSHEFVWGPVIEGIDHLAALRRDAMDRFLDDYTHGKTEARYIDCELPNLPFDDGSFDLAVCSHFLFLYSEHHDVHFHIDALVELCRVAPDVRVFPLLELGSQPSRHLNTVVANLNEMKGLAVTVETVDYEFQRGGNTMLRIRSTHGT